MDKTCEFIIPGKELKSFVRKYRPSHLNEISSDDEILLIITYEEQDGEITRFINIETEIRNQSSSYFNSAHAHDLIRYVLPAFYGLKSSPEEFAIADENTELLQIHFKIIAHLREHALLDFPMTGDELRARALLRQSNQYKISYEEVMLLPAIHALEVNMKIYEDIAESRCYKQSAERVTSLRAVRIFINGMRESIISHKLPFSKLIEIFNQVLENEIVINLKDHAAKSRLGLFFKLHTPKLVETYQQTLDFLNFIQNQQQLILHRRKK